MHDIIYEIQYRHHVQRGHRLLHEKESREEHLLSNSLYLPLHFEAAEDTLIFYNIIRNIIIAIKHLSDYYRTYIRPLLNIYRISIDPLRTSIGLSNYYRTFIKRLLDHYWSTLNIYRTSIGLLLNIYHYQTSIKLLLNIYQILIVSLYNHYLFIDS